MADEKQIRHFYRWANLPAVDFATLQALLSPAKEVRRHDQPVGKTVGSKSIYFLLSGWAIIWKVESNGKRQIVSILVPGDIYDASRFHPRDYHVTMITHGSVGKLSLSQMSKFAAERPAVLHMLLDSIILERNILREWLVNTNVRGAYHRVAHFLCEIYTRCQKAGLVSKGLLSFPLTQTDIAESVGLTAVHVNRTIRQLRDDGFIEVHNKFLRMDDFEGLRRTSGFDSTYLETGKITDS